MKFIVSLFLTLLFFFPQITYAHSGGFPILKINGIDAKVYQVGTAASTGIFDLPPNIDIAPENYLIKQKLNFEIDTSKLPLPPEIFKDTNFIWDFGDGSQKQTIRNGITNTHTYKKIGTFVIQIVADYSNTQSSDIGSQIIETMIINILPNKNYQIPKPIIQINGNNVPASRSVNIDLNNRLTFDASQSKIDPSTKIVSYQWDLDDGTTSNQVNVSHRYKLPQFYATPLLRVKDANGFFTDDYVTVRNSGKNDPNDPEAEDRRNLLLTVGGIILLVTILGASVFWIFNKKNKNKR
jgi:PKD repeat protein